MTREAVVASSTERDQLCINTVRTLAMDAVQHANSGHPGTPMALAPLGYVLWTKHLRHNPSDPTWPDRDRFVLSCGHASMLLYSLLYLTGYDLSLDDIKHFRQWGSRTPGHPEYGLTPGVEVTTGPLGQGFGNAVGMAIAEAHLAAEFARPGHEVIGHRTYFMASDGDLMEGISHEAASLAGHLRLGNLIGMYDDNHITIDGDTALTFSDDTAKRFAAYGWHVQRVNDGNDLAAIDQALTTAQRETARPSLIIVRTHIAYGSPNKQDTAAAHGAPLGKEEIRLTKANLAWPYLEPFTVPDDALKEWRRCRERGAHLQAEWERAFETYARVHHDLAAELERRLRGDLPPDWREAIPRFGAQDASIATRSASERVMNALAPKLPEFVGGSADLHESNKTLIKQAAAVGPGNLGGRNMYFGIREHGMGAVLNGMALHGGFMPYGATFLIFSDYMRPPIRLAALMGIKVIYVFTHDSIGLGEDGPTHQPVEMLPALRAVPNLTVIRPADAAETAEAWRVAIEHRGGPVALALTRQKVSPVNRERLAAATGLARGGYILFDPPSERPDVLLIASGSEVGLVLQAQGILEQEGIGARVVSMPSLEIFLAQPEAYRDEVLPPDVPWRLAVEAAHPLSWHRIVGERGDVLGVERFGASAPYERVFEGYGFTPEHVAARARRLLAR